MATEEASRIKVENFKIGRDTSSEINSGLIILLIGIPIAILPILITAGNIYSPRNLSVYPSLVGESLDATFIFFGIILLYGSTFITSSILGWTIGGLSAALLYGEEGKNGPLYASYLILRLIAGFSLLMTGTILIGLESEGTLITLGVVLALFIVSLPLILIGSIAYRIGLWISPK